MVCLSHVLLVQFLQYLKNDDNYAEDRLEEAELESPLLAKPGMIDFNLTFPKLENYLRKPML